MKRMADRLKTLAAALLVCLGIARIVSTYDVFTQTFDEPLHLACGMQWLSEGRYAYEPLHPPIARAAIALPLYATGLRALHNADFYVEGNALLWAGGDYFQSLALARSGILPFFALAGAGVWLWTRRYYGSTAALAAVAFFTCLPPVLGHAGIATTDVAAAATLTLSLYALLVAIEKPTPRNAALLGAAIGFAAATKFSTPVFFLFCLAASAVVIRPFPLRLRHALIAAGAAALVVWASYGFQLKPYPFHDFAAGLAQLEAKRSEGQLAYLLGMTAAHGWWFFFPVVLAVKTPLAFLALGIAAVVIVARRMNGVRGLPAWFALAILFCAMISGLNLGVRHILPLYACVAVAVGAAITLLSGSTRFAAWALLALGAFESAAAHPDYIAHFNWLAGSQPEKVLAGSDLDIGQDLHRLSRRARELGIPSLTLAYFGTADPRIVGLPPAEELMIGSTGWIAASVSLVTIYAPARPEYQWLAKQTPSERIGRSIFLYHLAPAAEGESGKRAQ
jgi:hypothetical protein